MPVWQVVESLQIVVVSMRGRQSEGVDAESAWVTAVQVFAYGCQLGGQEERWWLKPARKLTADRDEPEYHS